MTILIQCSGYGHNPKDTQQEITSKQQIAECFPSQTKPNGSFIDHFQTTGISIPHDGQTPLNLTCTGPLVPITESLRRLNE